VGQIRLLILIGGVCLPFVAALVNSSLPFTWGGILMIGVFNSICWGSILVATAGYRDPSSAIFPVVIGYAWPTLFYLTFDGKSSPFGLVFVPIENVVFVLIGWLVGRYAERRNSVD
jgi:hypothetical protein